MLSRPRPLQSAACSAHWQPLSYTAMYQLPSFSCSSAVLFASPLSSRHWPRLSPEIRLLLLGHPFKWQDVSPPGHWALPHLQYPLWPLWHHQAGKRLTVKRWPSWMEFKRGGLEKLNFRLKHVEDRGRSCFVSEMAHWLSDVPPFGEFQTHTHPEKMQNKCWVQWRGQRVGWDG